jgi:DNA processing protein
VRDTGDVLDLLADVTGAVRAPRAPAPPSRPAGLDATARRVLDAIEAGRGTLAELATTPEHAREVLLALGRLEGAGLVVRGFGGRYERAAT